MPRDPIPKFAWIGKDLGIRRVEIHLLPSVAMKLIIILADTHVNLLAISPCSYNTLSTFTKDIQKFSRISSPGVHFQFFQKLIMLPPQ